MKKSLNDFTTSELKYMREVITSCKSIDEVVEKIDAVVSGRNVDTLNQKLTVQYMFEHNLFCIETPIVCRILIDNGIHNMQDLVDCDLHKLVGMTDDLREKVEIDIKWYRNSKTKKGNKR